MCWSASSVVVVMLYMTRRKGEFSVNTGVSWRERSSARILSRQFRHREAWRMRERGCKWALHTTWNCWWKPFKGHSSEEMCVSKAQCFPCTYLYASICSEIWEWMLFLTLDTFCVPFNISLYPLDISLSVSLQNFYLHVSLILTYYIFYILTIYEKRTHTRRLFSFFLIFPNFCGGSCLWSCLL